MQARSTWWIYAVLLPATVVTYWRLPPGSTYHFNDTGISGAVSRSITYLNYPVAIAAIAIVWSCTRGRWAVMATLLCAVAFFPGVVSTDDLEASWANLAAAAGVVIAVWITLAAPAERPLRLSPWRKTALVVLAVWSVPWIIASLGLFAQDLPLLGHVIRSAQPTPGEPDLPSVHRGLHEGLFGAQLAATAIILSARRRPLPLSLYLALILVYGVMVTAQDGWNEQVVKRGWTARGVPDVLSPSLSLAWAGVIAATIVVHLAWFRRHAAV